MNGFSNIGRYAGPLSATRGFVDSFLASQQLAEDVRRQKIREQYQDSLIDINRSRADISAGYLDLARQREQRLSQRTPLGSALGAYSKLRSAVDRGLPEELAYRFLDEAGVSNQFAPYDVFAPKSQTPSERFNQRLFGATESWAPEKWQQAAERKFLGARGDRTTLNVKGLTDLFESEILDWRDSLPGAMTESADIWGTPEIIPDTNFAPDPNDVDAFVGSLSDTYSELSGLPRDELASLARTQMGQLFGRDYAEQPAPPLFEADISPHLKDIQDFAQEELEKSEQNRLFGDAAKNTQLKKQLFQKSEPSDEDLDAALKEAQKKLGRHAPQDQIIAEARKILQAQGYLKK